MSLNKRCCVFKVKCSRLKEKKKGGGGKLCLAVKQRSIERVESFSDFPLNACDKHLLAHLRAYLYTQDFLARFSLAKRTVWTWYLAFGAGCPKVPVYSLV